MKPKTNTSRHPVLQSKNYYNIAQCRIDVWNNLRQTAGKLRITNSKSEEFKDLKVKIKGLLEVLLVIEPYWAYPGAENLSFLLTKFSGREYTSFANYVSEIVRVLANESYRSHYIVHEALKRKKNNPRETQKRQHYYEVLFVDNLTSKEEEELREKLADIRDTKDKFVDEIVIARTFQDALVALLFNYNIQAVVIRYGFPFKSKNQLRAIKHFISPVSHYNYTYKAESELGPLLGRAIKSFRPELDLYLVTETSIDRTSDEVLHNFRRVFFRSEDVQELHLSIKRGIRERFETPFFTALIDYSQRPTGVFHAMPISRGNSIFKSHWINDLGDFYGRNIFLAETSATTGGLDSLLQPTGPLKKAQQMAARAFGSQYTYFVTNGTSTSNKIVSQAIIKPGDIVLIDRDCHKSHHYSIMLSGAFPVYLDSYPIPEYSMYGAVPLKEIKHQLLKLKDEGRLRKVKMLILTNCTFDGLVYNVEKVMEEVLAIKPDMVFLWDEAWFGFAAFTPTYRQRTAMHVAAKLSAKYKSQEYREQYVSQKERDEKSETGLPTLPDPDLVKIRVYSTQSTHKTLSSLRQGSMIHICDEEFKRKAEESFHEAYMTHISTSANYQILASLDAGRRQTMFEGYELVEKSIEMAMILREKVTNHPKLKPYFDILTVKDFIPEAYRSSGLVHYYDPDDGWSSMEEAWSSDEFVLDPTKVTLYIGRTGVDGDTFKNRFLMDQFGIQINKTSRNTVLFMTNIGTTKSSIAYLMGVLLKIAKQLDDGKASLDTEELALQDRAIYSLTKEFPPLPDFSYFHTSFKPNTETPEGDLRSAFFMAYQEELCEHIRLEECDKLLSQGRELVSASFVIPYPPGFPVLVPGQVVSKEILNFMQVLDVKEIHGYRADLGLRLFTEYAIKKESPKQIISTRDILKNAKKPALTIKNDLDTNQEKDGKTKEKISKSK